MEIDPCSLSTAAGSMKMKFLADKLSQCETIESKVNWDILCRKMLVSKNTKWQIECKLSHLMATNILYENMVLLSRNTLVLKVSNKNGTWFGPARRTFSENLVCIVLAQTQSH